MKEVYIASMVRTPIGNLNGQLSSFSAIDLGAIAIKESLQRLSLSPDEVQEVFIGNVLQANVGQAPARQAALKAGLSKHTPCTTVNKVCSSGIKAIMFGTQSILLGDNDVVVTGGMESMSQTPHYLPNYRTGLKFGEGKIVDGIVRDALQDPYNHIMMGQCGELCSEEKKISRGEQDTYAFHSYEKARNAHNSGILKNEIVAIEYTQKKNQTMIIDKDEELNNTRITTLEDMQKLRPVFKESGAITAGNSSKINDGAAAITLISREALNKLGLKPLARIISYADAAQDPLWFTTAPAMAIPKALKKAQLTPDQIDAYEINEAFAVVALTNIKELLLDIDKVNQHGGAIAIGHPVGVSGCRIVMSLISVLKEKKGRYGIAAICNGGGGASAMVIEVL